MKYVSMIFLWLVAASNCWGQMTVDQRNHCSAVVEQSRGVAAQLRGPNIMGGVTQPSAGTPAQTYIGIQNSIGNDRKAADTIDVAWKTCALYDMTENAMLRINFALPAMQKDALNHRAGIILQMQSRLALLEADAQKRADVQNLTRMAMYSMQTARTRMDLDRASTQQNAALIYVPEDLSVLPIRQLLTNKQLDEIAAQEASAKLQRAGNWDVQLESGIHHQLFSSTPVVSTSASGTGAYGGVTFSWGLGSKSTDAHLNRSVEAYGKWKESQEGDVVRSAAALRQELVDSIAALQSSNANLLKQRQVIESNLETVKNSDTSAGLAFSYQLSTDRLLLQIEIEDTQYRLSILHDFLAENF